jgi:predicted transcriptional regulator
LPQRWEVLAARGPQAGEHNNDASLARWHVTLAAVRAGWSADEWVAAMPSWPWLAAQLANPRRLALARAEFLKAAAQWSGGTAVQNPDTSQHPLHGGGLHRAVASMNDDEAMALVHRRLRQVRTWLQASIRSGRLSPATHSVARGVLLFAHAGGSARIQVGVRALAIAAAVSRTTAAAALWELAELGLVRRVGRGIGRGADVWEVDLDLGDGLPPARGRIWATRGVFRIIGGHGAAEVYEALAAAGVPLSGRALAAALGRSPTTITAHLQELASWGLSDGGGRAGWVLGPADPDELALRLGAPMLMARQVAGFRAERAAWWRWLEARGLERPTKRRAGLGQVLLLPGSAPQRHSPAARGDRAGPDPHTRAVDLVRTQFGGVLISSTA